MTSDCVDACHPVGDAGTWKGDAHTGTGMANSPGESCTTQPLTRRAAMGRDLAKRRLCAVCADKRQPLHAYFRRAPVTRLVDEWRVPSRMWHTYDGVRCWGPLGGRSVYEYR